MTEKQIENNILTFLKEIGIFCWKNQSVGVWSQERKQYLKPHNQHHIKGVADILGILPSGRFLAIEVKAPKGRASPEQLTFITKINEAGGLAFLSRSVEQTFNSMRHALSDPDRLLPIVNRWIQYERNLSLDTKSSASKKELYGRSPKPRTSTDSH